MTIGQRIAQERKKLGLSQEQLGERLGVSRQAIYKWESDASLPEIDKLIALSRLFSLSVGELLGVEEPAEAPAAGEADLSEQQLNMVQEIVERYLQSQPAAEKTKKRRWPWLLAGAAALCAVLVMAGRLSRLSNELSRLQNDVGQINRQVSWQIDSVAGRVEQVLKAQNSLSADYSVTVVSGDLRANTVTLRAYALPKNYQEGMEVLFLAESGGELAQETGTREENGGYSAEITCPLTDDVSVSVVYCQGQQRQTQILEVFDYLYQSTLSNLQEPNGDLMWMDVKDGVLRFEDRTYYVTIQQGGSVTYASQQTLPAAEVKEIRMGLFIDQKLQCWLPECEAPDNYAVGSDKMQFFRQPALAVPLKAGQVIQYAALVTDTVGREFLSLGIPMTLDESGGQLTHADDGGVGLCSTDGWDLS